MLTGFEADFKSNRQFMAETLVHSRATPPVLLWRHASGGCKHLYYHLACRFLVQDDDTADVERVHGCWQWIMDFRRSTKFKFINGLLKLNSHLAEHGDFPPDVEMHQYLTEARAALAELYRAARNDVNFTPGATWDNIYRARFNLSATESTAFGDGAVLDARHGPTARLGFDYSIGVFMRWLLMPLRMYRFVNLPFARYFFIYENKSFGGREKKVDGESISREASIVFFEEHTVGGYPPVVVPVSSDVSGAPSVTPYTVAMLLRAAGFYITAPPGAADRDVELLYEHSFFDHGLHVYIATRVELDGDDNRWAFQLGDPADAEASYFDETPADQLTAIGLARLVSQRDGSSWKTMFGYSRFELALSLSEGIAPDAIVAGRGRGRGRGGRGIAARGRGG